MPTSLDDNKRLVTEFFACLGPAKDIDGALARMADDGTWSVIGSPERLPFFGVHTKDGIARLLRTLVPAMKDGLDIRPVGLVAEGDKVAMESTSFGELPGGRVYRNRCHFLVELRGGLVLHVREYMDTQQFAAAVSP